MGNYASTLRMQPLWTTVAPQQVLSALSIDVQLHFTFIFEKQQRHTLNYARKDNDMPFTSHAWHPKKNQIYRHNITWQIQSNLAADHCTPQDCVDMNEIEVARAQCCMHIAKWLTPLFFYYRMCRLRTSHELLQYLSAVCSSRNSTAVITKRLIYLFKMMVHRQTHTWFNSLHSFIFLSISCNLLNRTDNWEKYTAKILLSVLIWIAADSLQKFSRLNRSMKMNRVV